MKNLTISGTLESRKDAPSVRGTIGVFPGLQPAHNS